MAKKLTTDDIYTLKAYVPGKPMAELERELGITNCIKLASNENPIGPSPKAVGEIMGHLHDLHRYPDGGGFYLKKKISEKLGVPPDCIILGNGSNEILEIIVRTFLLEGEEAIIAEPSFVVYKMAAQAASRSYRLVPLIDGRHDLMAMADAINDKTKLVFIANPNNPTGSMNTKAEFDAFMARVPDDVIVIVDEAYFEYATDPEYADTLKHFHAGRRIIILRTFSKIYGLAGLRIGYGFAPAELNDLMNRVRQPFNTNSLAQAAAQAALDDDEHVRKAIQVNEDGKKYLCRELDRMGIRYYPTQTNFIYMELDRDAKAFDGALLRKGIIIRPMGPTQIRVTIGLMEENVRFIEELSRLL